MSSYVKGNLSIFCSFESSSTQRCLLCVPLILSDRKSSQISRTLLSILDDLNNVVIWMFSTCPLISKFFSPFTNPLGIVASALVTVGITVTFMLYRFFCSLAKSRYLSHFSLLFNFTLWSTRHTLLFGWFSVFCWLLLLSLLLELKPYICHLFFYSSLLFFSSFLHHLIKSAKYMRPDNIWWH